MAISLYFLVSKLILQNSTEVKVERAFIFLPVFYSVVCGINVFSILHTMNKSQYTTFHYRWLKVLSKGGFHIISISISLLVEGDLQIELFKTHPRIFPVGFDETLLLAEFKMEPLCPNITCRTNARSKLKCVCSSII